jgi:hypothetical protein
MLRAQSCSVVVVSVTVMVFAYIPIHSIDFISGQCLQMMLVVAYLARRFSRPYPPASYGIHILSVRCVSSSMETDSLPLTVCRRVDLDK